MSIAIGTARCRVFSPIQAVALYLSVFVLFWTLIPLLLGQEPPIDNFEQLNWALHPALGYAKHPPLPTLVLWLFERIAPAGIPLTHVLGALQVVCMLGLAWAVARDSLGGQRAWVAVLLITGISYYTLRMHFYNHNTALLCATAAAALCAWRAVNTGGARWWAALGVAWAAGMLSKYQMVLGIACNVAFAVLMMRSRPWQLARGLALAGGIAAACFAPHLWWLAQHHFPTLDYAAGVLGSDLSPGGRLDSVLRFLASQLTRLVGPCLALAGLHWIASHRPQAGAMLAARGDEQADSPGGARTGAARASAVTFWRIQAFGPLLLMAAMALFGGVDIEMHWGTAYLWALPPWYLSTTRGTRLAQIPPLWSLACIAAMQCLLMTGKALFPNL